MRGEGTCQESDPDNDEHPCHCVHRVRDRADVVLLCCFCGMVFVDEPVAGGPHGEYAPVEPDPFVTVPDPEAPT